jgi:CheY-like chemotaxis protein
MARLGPIIIIEDDADDQEIMKDVFTSLNVPNQLKFFGTCVEAYQYLETTSDKPFLIFSDINLPGMSGAELKKKINENVQLRRKSIPYVFLTTTSEHHVVLDAYENLSQGFFTKPNNIGDLKKMIEMILTYWKLARHPNPSLL